MKNLLLFFLLYLSSNSLLADFDALKVKAEAGDPSAQFNVASYYERGIFVPQDYKEALKWYRRAADQKYAIAQREIGTMYDRGLGVPQDYKKALKWYRLAAKNGSVGALFFIGRYYENGTGVPKDQAKALKWYAKAAGQRYEPAEFKMGDRDYPGKRPVFKDDKSKINIIVFKPDYPTRVPKLAIWNDGVFLMWPLSGKRDNFALVGRYDKEDLAEALKNIEKTGFFKLVDNFHVVHHASYTKIYVSYKSQSRIAEWHEYLNPGFGGDITTDPKYRKFVKTWNAVKAEVTKLTPVEIYRGMNTYELHKKDSFRGINLKSLSKTIWPSEKNPQPKDSSNSDSVTPKPE